MEMEEYEETMMGIMTKLRQYFNLNKYSLEEFLDKYGFKDRQEGLSFPRYFDFLRAVYPEISEEEAVYIFNITDIDSSTTMMNVLTSLKKFPRMKYLCCPKHTPKRLWP